MYRNHTWSAQLQFSCFLSPLHPYPMPLTLQPHLNPPPPAHLPPPARTRPQVRITMGNVNISATTAMQVRAPYTVHSYIRDPHPGPHPLLQWASPGWWGV
jgi:hypothetical protein